MVLHLVAITKLKLLAVACGGHGHGSGQLLAALLGLFVLKLPLISRYAPRSLGDAFFSSRLFLFRLSRVFFRGAAAAGRDGRWGRAFRLLSGRSGAGRRLRTLPLDEDSLHTVSMMML